jgi:FAD/FMN-containing dehydrogenase
MSRTRKLLLDLFPESKLEDRNGLTVLFAEDENDVVAVVNLAIGQKLKICPAASMAHIAPTDTDCVLVSSLRMNRLVEYSAGDLYVTLQSGVRLSDLNSLIADDQLLFVFGDCGYTGTIGGAVAIGLSAQLRGESIHIKRWVPSLSFVTPYGKHVKVGAVTLKSVAGYDVTKLLVGSNGRFGFITSVTLRLIHKSQERDFNGMTLNTPQVVHQSWKDVSSDQAAFQRNLKRNLDPHAIFPSL